MLWQVWGRIFHPKRLMFSWPQRISDAILKADEHHGFPEPSGWTQGNSSLSRTDGARQHPWNLQSSSRPSPRVLTCSSLSHGAVWGGSQWWDDSYRHQHFSEDKRCPRQMLSAGFSSSCVRIKCNVTCFKKTHGDSWNIPLHSRMEIIPWRHVNQLIRSKTCILFCR